MMWGYGDGWGAWGWLWMVMGSLFMLSFWVGIVLLIIWGIRALTRGEARPPRGEPTALDIARMRYARGEITREQFEQLKRDLS